MPRRPISDPDVPDAVFHVTARVNWRVFYLEPHACLSAFYRVLRECLALFGIDLLAYVLMSNHFHFVMRSPAAPLFRELTTRRLRCRHRRPWPLGHQKRSVRGQFMRRLMQRSSRMIQKELNLSGHFWEGSYHARRVADDTDLVITMAYDHLNPLRPGIVQAPEDYGRSSAAWWRDGGDSPLPLVLRDLPFGLSVPELRERLLVHQASKTFRETVAKFKAAGGTLARAGMESLVAMLREQGGTPERGLEVRTPTM